MSRTSGIAGAGGVLLALLALACAGGGGATAGGSSARRDHFASGDRLRATMRALDRLRTARLPQELDLAAERSRRGREAQETARGLAAVAAGIASTAPLEELAPDERETFLALAETLRARAQALAAEAPGLGPTALRERFAELDAACDACHRRFRDAAP